MAVQQVQNLPAQFVQDLGQDLAKQVVAQSGVPVVSTGLAGISQQPGETADDFAARQQAAREFTTRQQSLAGLAPQVAGQDALQQQAQTLATQGVGSFAPFLQQAQTAGTAAGTALGGVGLGATAFQQDVQDFMSPFQTQVIDATLAEFDRNTAQREQQIRDQQASLGVLGAGRAGVQLAEFGALNQAQAQANLDAQREAARQATFLPQEQLDRFAGQVTGIMGGYPGQTQTTNIPNPTPLQTALGVGSTLAGIYGTVVNKNPFSFLQGN
jgi:hypothetical protein